MKKILLSLTVAAMISGANAQAQTTIYGLTNANQMFTITNANSPSSISGPFTISGISSNQLLLGLDSRPDNGNIYALGYDTTSGSVQLYLINNSGSNSYSATAVGSLNTSMNLGTMTSGNSLRRIGFNFMSTTGSQIRIMGSNGYGYVMDATNGTTTSTGTNGVTYGSGSLYAGTTANIVAMTYGNSYYGADNADQYGLDLTNNALVSFTTADYGNGYNYTPSTVNYMGVIGLLLDANSNVGMDSWYDTASHHNTTYLSGSTLLSGGYHLYTLDNNSGLASDHGLIGDGSVNVQAITTSVNQYSSSTGSTTAEGQTMVGLTLNLRNLILFDSYNPNHILGLHHITGMSSGQTMIAITYGQDLNLYGLGYNSNNQTYQLYTINEQTGVATAVNATPASINLGSDNGSGANLNVAFAFVADASNRIRIIGNNGNTNDQLSATTGLIVSTDGALQYGSTDNNNGQVVNVGSIAYTNNYTNSNTTTMLGLDFNTGYLVSFDGNDSNSNSGSYNMLSSMLNLSTVLNLSLLNNNNNDNNNGYMDMYYDANTHTNLGFIATNYYGDSGSTMNYGSFYSMNANGATYSDPTYKGSIGSGTPVKSTSVKKTYDPTSVPTVANNTTLQVYPNPAINTTSIILDKAATDNVLVDVLDMNGRVVSTTQYAAGSNKLDVNMSTMPAGMYTVRVSQKGNATQNLKVVKE